MTSQVQDSKRNVSKRMNKNKSKNRTPETNTILENGQYEPYSKH